MTCILVVDDSEAARDVLERVLKSNQFEVLLAASGEQAVALCQSHRDTISLALLDVRMPDMDGPQTLTALREIKPELICCFMSGDTATYRGADLLASGAAHVFRKPIRDFEGFVSVLWSLIG